MPITRTPAVSSGRSFWRAASSVSAAEPLVVEQVLDGDEAADEVPDTGRRSTAIVGSSAFRSTCFADDDGGRQPFEVRGPRVVAVERLDHPGPRDPRDVAEEDERQRERGQEQVLRPASSRFAPGLSLRRHRQPAEPDREDEDEHDPRHEVRHRGDREAERRDPLVGRPPVAEPGDHAAEDRERHEDHEGDERELERVLERGPEQVPRRHLLRQRRAEVAVQDARSPSPCTATTSDRFVPSCSLSASTDSWVANGPSTARPTLPGRMLDDREDDHAEQDQRDQREADALDEEAGH